MNKKQDQSSLVRCYPGINSPKNHEEKIMQSECFFKKKTRLWVIIIGFVLAGLFYYLDQLTNSEMLSGVCYLAAVAYVTWCCGKLPGLLISVAGALSCFFNEYTGIDLSAHTIISYWNAGGMFGIFLVVTYLLSEVKEVHGSSRQTGLGKDAESADQPCMTMKGKKGIT